MKGVRKRFNKALYEENDNKAREAALNYLNSLEAGTTAVVNKDRYDPDIIVGSGVDNEILYYVEVEVKYNWKKEHEVFPYPTVQLPERKGRYVLKKGYNIEYWIFREDLAKVMVIPGKLLEELTPVEVPNKYVYKGEFFFQVPVEQCRFITIIGAENMDLISAESE